MPIRQTHTYVVLELSEAAVEEISGKLRAAGYDHAFHDGVVDMHGIAVSSGNVGTHAWTDAYPGIAVRSCTRCDVQRIGMLWRSWLHDVWSDEPFPTCPPRTNPDNLTNEQIRAYRNDPDRAVVRWARRATDRRLIGTRRAEARHELCNVINARAMADAAKREAAHIEAAATGRPIDPTLVAAAIPRRRTS